MRPIGLRITKILKATTVFTLAAVCSCAIYADPVLDNVAAGQATVQQSPGTTVVNQTSQQAILNWQSFNIGQGESTHFNQPSGGIALNRINPSQGASQIYGSLTATGQIILINPAGVYFGPGSYVNVGGMIATTANISDQNFMNGLYQFSKVDGYSGSIINEGQIVAAQNGLIALVAPGVINNGLIQVNLGKIVLASGDAFTFDFTGDQMINFAIDAKTSAQGKDKNGNLLLSGVENNGSLIANGGTVLVSASDASGVLDQMINLKGIVQAQSVAEDHGEVIISADPDKGIVRLAGDIDVSGKSAGEKGGHLTVTGHNILLDTGAMIDASGDVGGGNVLIGGNYQGIGPLAHANAVVMMPTASINGDAITSGNGGNIVLWSDQVTKVYGALTAQGGALNGNGGLVETSSKNFLDVNNASVNTLAANGETGMWLLDPSDITINNAATSGIGLIGNVYAPTADSSVLNATALGTALNGSNITVQTTNPSGTEAGNILFNDAAGSLGTTWTAATALTLRADNNITLNQPITLRANQTLNLVAGFTNTAGSILSSSTINGFAAGAGILNMTAGTAGNITINGLIGATNSLASLTVNSPITINVASVRTAGNQTYNGAVTPGAATTTLTTTAAASNITIAQPLNWSSSNILQLSVNTTTGTVTLPSSISAPNGSLFITAGTGVGSINAASVNVNSLGYLNILRGQWVQVSASLPTLNATNFRIGNIGTLFVRALGGNGSPGTPYLLTDIYGLQGINASATTLGYNYRLANNIDASATSTWVTGGNSGFTPIGSSTATPFTGVLDGQNFSISNLLISRTNNNVGLFVYNNGTIQNLNLVGGSITGGVIVGSIAANNGSSTFTGIIDNVTSSATVTSTFGSSTGGLVGINWEDTNNFLTSSITNSTYSGTLNMATCSFCGGIVGENYGVLDGVINRGNLTITTGGGQNFGGIAGINYLADGLSLITNSINSGTVNITGMGNVGGIVGQNSGSITNSYNDGTVIVESSTNIGGVVGYVDPDGSLTNSYNAGRMIISNSFAGGVVGYVDGIVDSIYNIGYVTAQNGGGVNATIVDANGTISNVYYNSDTSGAAGFGTALTSAQMTSAANFVGFDFGTVWAIVNGQSYPYLQSFYATAPRVITGTTTAGDSVGIATNGVQLGASAGANGAYYILAGDNLITKINSTIANGAAVVAYNTSGATVGNNIILASAGIINFPTLTSNTITIGNGNTATITNTLIATAIGAISNPSLLFSATGNDLTIGNATYPNVNLITTGTTTFNTTGNISTYAGGASSYVFNGAVGLNNNINSNGAQSYNAAVLLGANASINTTNGDLVFNSTLDRDATVRNLVLNAGAGAITLGGNVGFGVNNRLGTLTLNSSGVTSINGNVNAASLTTDTGGTTSLGSAIVNTTGDTVFNDAVTFAGAAKTITANNVTFNGAVAANTDASFTATTTSFLNGLTGNGALSATGSGGNNTLTVNSGNAQNYSITGTDVGVMTAAAGFTGSLMFTNIQNLIGGVSGNTFVFANNAVITGSVNGSNLLAQNTIDLTAYLQGINLNMLTTNDGELETAANALVANYSNIGTVNVNHTLNNTLTTPVAKASDIYITGAEAGYVNDPIFFNGFNYFVGTSTSTVTFPDGGVYNPATNSYTFGGVTMQFSTFGQYNNTTASTTPSTPVIVPGLIVNVIQQPPTNASQNNNSPTSTGTSSSPTWSLAGTTIDQNLTLITTNIINEYDNQPSVKINPYCYSTR